MSVASAQPEQSDCRRCKVLHVTWRLSETGGIANVIRNIVDHHDPSATDVHVAVARTGVHDDLDDLVDRCAVHILMPDFGRGSGHVARARLMWAIARLVRQERPEVVQTHSGTAWWTIFARLVSPRRRWLIEVHDAPGNGRHGAATERLEGFLCRRLGYVAICHSSSVVDEVRLKWRLPSGGLRMFPLGVDTRLFAAGGGDEDFRRRIGADAQTFVVIGVGRLVPSKQFDQWLDIAAALRASASGNCRFVIVGDGPERESLEERAAQLGFGDEVVFTGSLSQHELVGQLSSSDAYLSTSAYEGFGLTVVEAMAAAVPIVVSNVGGHRDLVEHGVTGWLCDGADDSLARLMQLNGDASIRLRMGLAGQRRAIARFDISGFAREFDALYAGEHQRLSSSDRSVRVSVSNPSHAVVTPIGSTVPAATQLIDTSSTNAPGVGVGKGRP